jgi:hypothetical protein
MENRKKANGKGAGQKENGKNARTPGKVFIRFMK